MNAGWLETAGVLVVILLGAILGARMSRLPRPWWTLGFILPLAGLLLITAVLKIPRLTFDPAFSWLVAGRTEFVLLGAFLPMMIFTPLFRLPRRSAHILGAAYTTMAVGWFCFMPFLTSAALTPDFEAIDNRIDKDGVCHQSRRFLCGPAAAVTMLRMVGVPAHEGELAIIGRSSPVHGTDPISLCHAVRATTGVDCEYKMMVGIEELEESLPAIVLLSRGPALEHYVTVIDVTATHVVVGDPLRGRREIGRERFERIWRRSAITLQ